MVDKGAETRFEGDGTFAFMSVAAAGMSLKCDKTHGRDGR